MRSRAKYSAPAVRDALGSAALLLALLTAGCAPEDLVGEGELPPDVSDPDATESPAGAVAAYRGALIAFRSAVGGDGDSYIPTAGLMTDEMQTLGAGGPGLFGPGRDVPQTLVDRRALTEISDIALEQQSLADLYYVETHRRLQRARGQAMEAARLLREFAPEVSPALAAHLQAVEAYADIYLADLFCSGIPLSTVEADGFRLAPGAGTAEVYDSARALLQAAIAGGADSARIVNFARVGLGRALLALGRYAEAASSVAAVPDGFEYQLQYDASADATGQSARTFMWTLTGAGFFLTDGPTIADVEGANGLDYFSSGDPRIDPQNYAFSFSPGNPPQFLPGKFAPDGSGNVTIAGWREARLIEAEAALQAGDAVTWLSKLNALREAATFPPAPDDPTSTPRVLPPLADPTEAQARVELTFRERAFWLFLQGQRQGDMRRLIRQYDLGAGEVYPTGQHPRGNFYASEVTAPIPAVERQFNSRFTGCLDRGA